MEPQRCNRCCEQFGNVDELIQHQRSDPPCQVRERPPARGIDRNQLELLKVKKRGTEYAKCRRIYRILWPNLGDEDLPCPCKCSCWDVKSLTCQLLNHPPTLDWDIPVSEPTGEPSAAEFNAFLQQELSPFLRQKLDNAFPVDQAVSKPQVVALVETALREMYDQWRLKCCAADGESSAHEGATGLNADHGGPGELEPSRGVAETDAQIDEVRKPEPAAQVWGEISSGGIDFDERGGSGDPPNWWDNGSWSQIVDTSTYGMPPDEARDDWTVDPYLWVNT